MLRKLIIAGNNMKKFLLIFIAVFLTFSACKAQVKSADFDWKEFVSEEGKFKAKFPTTPEQTIRTSPLGDGKIKYPKIELSLPQINFSISYGDIPDLRSLNDEELKEYYSYLRTQTIRLNNSQLVSERSIMIDEKAGHEFIEKRNNKTVTHRMLLVENRLYQIGTEIDTSLEDDDEVRKIVEVFLSSFQIIGK
jgi:hypothetical protein